MRIPTTVKAQMDIRTDDEILSSTSNGDNSESKCILSIP